MTTKPDAAKTWNDDYLDSGYQPASEAMVFEESEVTHINSGKKFRVLQKTSECRFK